MSDTFDRAMRYLLTTGQAYALCSRCKHTLTVEEHDRRSCRSCGRFDDRTFEIQYMAVEPNRPV